MEMENRKKCSLEFSQHRTVQPWLRLGPVCFTLGSRGIRAGDRKEITSEKFIIKI